LQNIAPQDIAATAVRSEDRPGGGGSTQPHAAGLYIHIPFCLRKCVYCDFYSVTERSRLPDFLEALEKEIQWQNLRAPAYDTLYFGGGTPSLLEADPLDRIIQSIGKHFNLQAHAEITLEVNPGTVSRGKLMAYRRMGINRLNIGVQSFDNGNLRFLGRVHDAHQSRQVLDQARQAGFENLGLDLIYGLPNQTAATWRRDLAGALAWKPEHLSCYMLTLEAGTPLAEAARRGKWRPLSDGQTARLFKVTVGYLADHGYRLYEVSNFARLDSDSAGDFRSRHNRKYWSQVAYTGLGPSAHGFRPPCRLWNQRSLADYLNAIAGGKLPVAGVETLSARQEFVEALFLGLRTREGIHLQALKERFGFEFQTRFAHPLKILTEEGLIVLEADRCRLTLDGMLVMDSVIGMFL
jgi:oxygen-independent coproporphyrinogen-3 oxidase